MQKGLLKRFSISCYGKQKTIEDIRSEKSNKFLDFKNVNKNSNEYKLWFLKYNPDSKKKANTTYKKKNKTNFTRKNLKKNKKPSSYLY